MRELAAIVSNLPTIFAVLLLLLAEPANGQLRIVTYNTANGEAVEWEPRSDMDVVLEAIGDESVGGIAKPIDILVLQEQYSSATTTQTIVNILNGIYDTDVYTRATLNGDTWGAGRPGLIFNTQSISLLEQTAFGQLSSQGQVRQTLRYKLRPVGYDSSADFYVYSNHYKAGYYEDDMARREVEATAVRADADALGPGAHIIYAGDYNIQSSDEASYETLLAAGYGQAFDPIDTPGDWHNEYTLKHTHTQAPAWSPPAPLVGGGMDDRFDFQLVTGEMLDDEGLSYIPGSYHAFGNNGTHQCCNSSITTGNGAAADVLAALSTVSDHLPVAADYQLPAMMNVSVALPPDRVIVGADIDVQVTVENTAPVVAAHGADELDYDIAGLGAVGGSTSSTVAAISGGNVHDLPVYTSTAGYWTGEVSVSSASQAVANGSFSQGVAATVLDHCRPSFAAESDTNLLFLDFGDVPVGSGVQSLAAGLWNLDETGGDPNTDTAALDLDSVTGDPNTGTAVLTTNLEPLTGLAVGSQHPFNVYLDTAVTGDFYALYRLEVSDEDLPGAQDDTSLSMVLLGSVYLPGDLNGDGQVNGLDVDPFVNVLLNGHYIPRADMNDDDIVNGLDVEPFVASVAGGGALAVPEPSAWGLLALGAVALLVARRTAEKRAVSCLS